MLPKGLKNQLIGPSDPSTPDEHYGAISYLFLTRGSNLDLSEKKEKGKGRNKEEEIGVMNGAHVWSVG